MRVTPLPGCKVICHDLVAAQVYVVLLHSQAFLLRVWPESGAPRRLDVCAPGLELKQEVSTLQCKMQTYADCDVEWGSG